MTTTDISIDILVYSSTTDDTVARQLGRPEYSYYFVAKRFLAPLQAFGSVRRLEGLETLDSECRDSRSAGRIPVLFCFCAPHHLPHDPPCEVIPVFAWEYDTIPFESWTGDPRDNWVETLRRTSGAITHSEHTRAVVEKAVGSSYNIASIPAPVWDSFQQIPEASLEGLERFFDFEGIVLDSSLAAIAADGRMELSPSMGRHRVNLTGVVFTTVLNPVDGRKNIKHLITAFVHAFRDNPDAALVLKLIHTDADEALGPIIRLLARLHPHRCRVLAVFAFLDENAYCELVKMTTWVVNASVGEGQCLPLMEFLSAGRPAIAPNHTAMADYIDGENAIIVDSSREWTSWPHDMRWMLRCTQHRIDWGSLRNAYQRAFQIATGDKERYREMSDHGRERARRHNSTDAVTRRLASFMSRVVPRAIELEAKRLSENLSAEQHEAEEGPKTSSITAKVGTDEASSRQVGVVDAHLSGWFRGATGELFEGFAISPSDIVIDVGCGEGHHLTFCARQGADLIGVDVDPQALAAARAALLGSGARRLELHEASAENLPLPDALGTRIICSEVLEHVDDPARAMTELTRIGRPGALYLFTVPDKVAEELQLRVAPEVYFQKPNHIRIFERDALPKLASQAGLEVLSHTAYGFYWSIWWGLFWATDVDLTNAEHPVLNLWSQAWGALLASPSGPRIKRGLDAFMPKSRVVLARKPVE